MTEDKLHIVTHKRNDDWIAYLASDSRVWDCGTTEIDAIGRLMISRAASEMIIIDREINWR